MRGARAEEAWAKRLRGGLVGGRVAEAAEARGDHRLKGPRLLEAAVAGGGPRRGAIRGVGDRGSRGSVGCLLHRLEPSSHGGRTLPGRQGL